MTDLIRFDSIFNNWKKYINRQIRCINLDIQQMSVSLANRKLYKSNDPDLMEKNKIVIKKINNRLRILYSELYYYKAVKQKLCNKKVCFHLTAEATEKIATAIIEKCYTLRIKRLGSISIVTKKVDPKRKYINWNESNKLKKLYIEQGITPYNKDTAPEGRKWFIYHDQELIPLFYWKNSLCTYKNSSLYGFKPSGGDYGHAKTLHRYVKSHPLVLHNYIKWNR